MYLSQLHWLMMPRPRDNMQLIIDQYILYIGSLTLTFNVGVIPQSVLTLDDVMQSVARERVAIATRVRHQTTWYH